MNNKIRLALVVPSFPKLSETFIVRKFLGLLDQGFDVHVVCSTSDEIEWSRFPGLKTRASGRVHRTLPTRPRGLAAAIAGPALVAAFLKRPKCVVRYLVRGWKQFGPGVFRFLYLDLPLVMLQPDVIHFEFGSLVLERIHLKQLLDCRLVVSFRGYDLNFSGLDQKGYYDEVWQNIDAFHFLGEDLWKRAIRRGCPRDVNRALIPPAVDLDYWKAEVETNDGVLGTCGRPLRILSVGRLEWKKGHEYALQAIRTLVGRGVECEYRIVGAGQYLEALAFARHDLKLENHVIFHGALAPHEVREEMSWADVLLHPSVSEGFCNAAIEAQAMGLPVVCSDAGGLGENVDNGRTGFVVERRNAAALVEKMEILAESGTLRLEMGRRGRARVEELFSLDSQIGAFEKLYRSL